MAVGSAAATATVGMTAAGANTDEAGRLRLARTWARASGLEQLREKERDVALLDITLPGKSGYCRAA